MSEKSLDSNQPQKNIAVSSELKPLLVLRNWIQEKDDDWFPKMHSAEENERYSEAFMWQQMRKAAEIITEKIDELLKQK